MKKSQQMLKLMTVLAVSLASCSDFIGRSVCNDSQQHTYSEHIDRLGGSMQYAIAKYSSSQSN